MIKLNKLLACIEINTKDERIIKGVSDKFSDIDKDWIFVAIKGENVDGNIFGDMAIDKGAIVISENIKSNYIYVKDSKIALCNLLHCFSGNLCEKLFMIGITGTNGKTTTATLIKDLFTNFNIDTCAILTHKIFFKDKIITTNNTTPDPKTLVDMLEQCFLNNVKVVIMELSSEAMYYKRLNNFSFDIIICTNISSDHLNTHKTIENYIECKKDILQLIKNDGLLVLNHTDDIVKKMAASLKSKIIFFGESNCEYKINNIRESIQETTFDLNDYHVKCKLLSKLNAYNLSACIVVGILCNLNIEKIIKWCNDYELENGRLQIIRKNPFIIVDYAHTTKAFDEILAFFNRIKMNKIITVFGCGGDRDKSKRPLMGQVVSDNSDICILTNDNPRKENPDNIIKDIIKGCSNNYFVVKDRTKAIEFAIKNAENNDIILVLGKGIEKYQLINDKKIYHDDIETIKNFGG